ncbi:MAG: bifunctional [glutamate--ammonia ligase]-adenylyl-L-tyrosine phosphorylase/[glutamate--ammonia-ligase] adenylyltransferase [Betaproteobacteria bacterium]|nr:bifunctional [glutamate--ammonia ligase]-adenylyl-L-tyrosine phosphorylase/[glutamate--ammonia-ligase] adenylyltransferase [Betaproteobacteria bacterium]
MNTKSRPDAAGAARQETLAAERAARLSRYARNLMAAEPELRQDLESSLARPFDAGEMESVLLATPVADEAALSAVLRHLRKRVMLRVIVRDLSGLADLAEVMATVTALAETAIRFAASRLAAWMEAQHGSPAGAESAAPQELLVVGMGKLGGGELNVSSDVDLIFVYPEDGETTGRRALSNHEFFVRLGRKLIASLNDLTSEGFVFRVDMRLRPHGESGPLAVSFPMLEEYLLTQGREWERYAWIKGRPLCGSRARELSELVRPFVFRKYLDFGAYASLRNLHAQIRQEVRRREMEDNIKLGPGGIREIEFIAQVFQLIRGGRDSTLRARPTLAVLKRLGELKLLPREAVAELTEAYVFLRNLEHRLQYLDDRQTQSLPGDAGDRALVAEAMGFPSYQALRTELDIHRSRVTRHFEQVFATGGQGDHDLADLWADEIDRAEASARLATMGFAHPEEICERLQQMRHGVRYRQLPRQSQERMDTLVPPVIQAAAHGANPDATLERMLQLLEAINRRASYLALLQEYPQALDRVAKLASASQWAFEYLTQHPILLDELLDPRELHAPPDWSEFRLQLESQLADAAGDTERQMDVLRHFHHSKVFRLVAMDLEGLLPLETLSDHLSFLADLVLSEVLKLCWGALRNRHQEGPPRFAIAGYGKLGGKELGYATDLDIIFLYDDPHPDAAEVYARLGQRINSWLTSYTAAGVLYETDLRLRPDGASGLLVSPLAAFTDYQRHHAWVWEHQALTRARFVAGEPEVGAAFEALRREVLCQTRDLPKLREEIQAMRAKMLEAHPNPSGLFDVKHDRGGIIDVEFIVQYLVLGFSSVHLELTANAGNIALLKTAAELALIPADLAEEVRNGYREYRRTQHRLRLSGEQYARVEPGTFDATIRAVLRLWLLAFGAPGAGAPV